jgi:hypothetical protein
MVTVDGAAGLWWRGRTLGIMNPSSSPAARVSPVRRIARTSRTVVLTSSQGTVVTIGVIHLMLGRGEAVSGALFSAGGVPVETQIASSSSDTSSTEEMTGMCSLRRAGPAELGFALRPQRHLLVDSGLKAARSHAAACDQKLRSYSRASSCWASGYRRRVRRARLQKPSRLVRWDLAFEQDACDGASG